MSKFAIFTAFLQLFSPFEAKKTFCVKCGLDAVHFIKLVRMQTKSAIADLYESTDSTNVGNTLWEYSTNKYFNKVELVIENVSNLLDLVCRSE